ncbi:unnamed protein product [Durusdinium trenchii]|uniref:EF-hand domain-containing protein n=1 Tax=Durusdinium trenchii TaxID=1381693 RepID=A0ABP0Q039_9DINO
MRPSRGRPIRSRPSRTSTGTDASRLFQRLDADRDGAAWSDTGDSFLGLPDLANLFRAFQPDCPSTVLAEAFRHFGLDQKTCIDEEDFCTRLEANRIERLEEAGWTQCFSWMPGPEARCLVPSEAEGLLKLLGSNVSNLPAECNDLEFVIPGPPVDRTWGEGHRAVSTSLVHKR